MSSVASNDEQWYFLPPQICFREYTIHSGQKTLHQKVLARSTQHFQTATVELTSFSLDCFGIIGTSVLENAGPDATFVFSVSFVIPPPEGLLLQGEYHSNFQDQLHIRHSVSGAILASLVVKAIWDLTPDNVAAFFPSMLPPVSSSFTHALDTAELQPRALAGNSKQYSAPASTNSADHLRRPMYDEAEDSFYRSLLAGSAAPRDTPVSTTLSAPKDCRIQLSVDDAAFYSSVIAGVKAAPVVEYTKKANASKSVVHFEGDEIIIIDGIKYDTWGNTIANVTESNSQLTQDSVKELSVCDALAAKKKLPQLGPTIIRGSNVPAMTSQAIPGGDNGVNRYLEILEGKLIPETEIAAQVRGSTMKRPGKIVGGTGFPGSGVLSQAATSSAKSTVSTTFLSHQQKAQSSPIIEKSSKKGPAQFASFSPVKTKTEDQLNDAWDAL